jgi:signal transduction histidine kinase
VVVVRLVAPAREPAEKRGLRPRAALAAATAVREEEVRLREFCHDLLQPVATICMLVAAAAVEPDTPPALRARLELIDREARRLRELAGATLREPVTVDGTDLAAVIGPVVASRQITSSVVVRLRALVSCSVLIDPPSLARAVDNLLDNALRAAGECGRVEVSTRRRGRWVHVDVDDDGPGFGAAPGGAASVGLGIVSRTAQRQGGRVEFRPSPLGGTRARLVLPARTPPRGGPSS